MKKLKHSYKHFTAPIVRKKNAAGVKYYYEKNTGRRVTADAWRNYRDFVKTPAKIDPYDLIEMAGGGESLGASPHTTFALLKDSIFRKGKPVLYNGKKYGKKSFYKLQTLISNQIRIEEKSQGKNAYPFFYIKPMDNGTLVLSFNDDFDDE